MAAATSFDSAVEHALELSHQHYAARTTVEHLTRELSASVLARTEHLVRVAFVEGSRALATLGAAVARLAGAGVGIDPEDQTARGYVVAEVDSNARRVLWEVEFHDAGYPVTIHGPSPGATTTCLSEDDVRDAFIDAAGHGLVGRKLDSLARYEQLQRTKVEVAGGVEAADAASPSG